MLPLEPPSVPNGRWFLPIRAGLWFRSLPSLTPLKVLTSPSGTCASKLTAPGPYGPCGPTFPSGPGEPAEAAWLLDRGYGALLQLLRSNRVLGQLNGGIAGTPERDESANQAMAFENVNSPRVFLIPVPSQACSAKRA